MRGILGPGLLIVAALALPFPLVADTGGAVEATLTIVAGGPIGGGGGVGEPCASSLGPPLPPLQVSQRVSLFHDVDGDGLLDPGDMLAYSAEVENLSPGTFEGLRMFLVFHNALTPFGLPSGWRQLELGALRALDVELPPLRPFGKVRVGFTARFEGEETEVPAVFVQAYLYGKGFSVAADDPATAAVLDPLVIGVRETVGGAAAAFPGQAVLAKEVTTFSSTPRLVSPGDTVEFRISYTALDGGSVELVDFVPPPLRVRPETISAGDLETVGGGFSLIRARFTGLSPGDRVSLRYRAEVGGLDMFTFLATRALAVLADGETVFSDDPGTAALGDPTALLFPWTYGYWSPELWGEFSRRSRCILPVIVRDVEGNESLRWAFWGPGELSSAGPGDLVFAEVLEVPVAALTGQAGLGFLLTHVPPDFQEAFVPGIYGEPVFVPLSGGTDVIQGLKGGLCGEIFLPLLVQLPAKGPVYLTGVVVDEGT